MIYIRPTTKTEYWNIVDEHWDKISHVLNIYLPTFKKHWIDNSPLDETLGDFILNLKQTRNQRIVRAFNAALWNLSDNRSLYEYPVSILYDLCVLEDSCLNEEKEE